MSTLPTSVTQEQFEQYIRPALSVAKRGYECSSPLYKVFNYSLFRLHTGCQWARLPIDNDADEKEISYHAVYHHYRTWSRDGSLERVFQQSILSIRDQIDTQHLNLDGSHAPAKKGGEAVAYQGRKKAKTSNVLTPMGSSWQQLALSRVITTMPLNSRTIYGLCWCALTAKQCTSWALTTASTPSSTSAIYWRMKRFNELMNARPPISDPKGHARLYHWDVLGSFSGKSGIWELVVDLPNRTIVHFLFKSH